MFGGIMKRLLVLALLAFACDQKDQAAFDASPALSALIPPAPVSATPSASAARAAQTQATPPPGDAGGACGLKPLPDCPLQGWMKQNMTPAMNAHDWQGLSNALEHAATLAPPDYAAAGYVNWVSIARDGANAARAADLEAVKAACRGCHEQYKKKYRTEMRTRPLPP